ncbi:MAG: hypothetical protein LBE35_06795 [Clostridiales bacterium]|jgi:hypothetical protein|nr:hypothetical protein [Clostridiales bacterium]
MHAKTLNWGKLFYPKFMENDECRILGRGRKIWAGRCHFWRRIRGRQEGDGQGLEINAGATTDQNIACKLDDYEHGELEFLVKKGGQWRPFLVMEFRPHFNPNGSFHHLRFGLLDRGCSLENRGN